jgi:hypothetical protein
MLKKILKQLTKDARYYAEIVDTVAEIYFLGDTKPTVLVELINNMVHLNFRSDLSPESVAQISLDISKSCDPENIAVCPSFLSIPDKGVVYGEDATAAFYLSIYITFRRHELNNSMDKEKAIFVVENPIYGYGIKQEDINNAKYRKMWGE